MLLKWCLCFTYPNVIIVTTSNIMAAIDFAFVARADIKQYVGLPSVQAIYKIDQSCILELKRVHKFVYTVPDFTIWRCAHLP